MILHNSSEIRKSAPMALASPGLPTRPRLDSPQSSQYIYTFSSPPSSTRTHIKMIIKKHKNHPIQMFYTCEVVRTRTLCLTQTAVEKHRTHLLPLNVDLDQSTNKPNNDVRNKLHRDHIHMIRKHEQKQLKKNPLMREKLLEVCLRCMERVDYTAIYRPGVLATVHWNKMGCGSQRFT